MGSIDKACISGFLCRLCSEMHRIVIHIYGDQGQRLCLVEKINGYLPITISPTDPLPKTICTTCLRRVEQHYDLLMRLSRIREERFVGVKKHRHRFIDLELSEVSSVEVSEDDIYHSGDESRRRSRSIIQQASTSVSSILSEPETSSSSAGLTTEANFASSTSRREHSTVSRSANALVSVAENVSALEDTASTSSNSNQVTFENVGDNLELVVSIHHD